MARQSSPKPAPLSQKRYAALLRDVCKLLDTAEESANEQKVLAYWRLGQRISTERIAQGAGYHNSVLRDLAADSRIAIRTLQRAVLFHSAYSKPPASRHLAWSHYFILATVASADDRARFQKLAIDEGLSARQLAAAVQVGWADDGSSAGASSLPRPTEPSLLAVT